MLWQVGSPEELAERLEERDARQTASKFHESMKTMDDLCQPRFIGDYSDMQIFRIGPSSIAREVWSNIVSDTKARFLNSFKMLYKESPFNKDELAVVKAADAHLLTCKEENGTQSPVSHPNPLGSSGFKEGGTKGPHNFRLPDQIFIDGFGIVSFYRPLVLIEQASSIPFVARPLLSLYPTDHSIAK